MLGHIFNIKVVLDQGICLHSTLESIFEPSDEYTDVFIVKKDKNSVELAPIICESPDAIILLAFGAIVGDFQPSPVTEIGGIAPKTACFNSLASIFAPIFRQLGVKLEIVKGLEWQPTSWSFDRVSIFTPVS